MHLGRAIQFCGHRLLDATGLFHLYGAVEHWAAARDNEAEYAVLGFLKDGSVTSTSSPLVESPVKLFLLRSWYCRLPPLLSCSVRERYH